jgi:hypothetical protein
LWFLLCAKGGVQLIVAIDESVQQAFPTFSRDGDLVHVDVRRIILSLR